MLPAREIRTRNSSLLHGNPSRPRRLLPPLLPLLIVLPTTNRTKSETLWLISNLEVKNTRVVYDRESLMRIARRRSVNNSWPSFWVLEASPDLRRVCFDPLSPPPFSLKGLFFWASRGISVKDSATVIASARVCGFLRLSSCSAHRCKPSMKYNSRHASDISSISSIKEL